MVLHCLAVTHAHPAYADCLAMAGPADTILLLGDGVYNAFAGSDSVKQLAQHPARVVLLEPDARAMGLASPTRFPEVDMSGFVELTAACPRRLAWY